MMLMITHFWDLLGNSKQGHFEQVKNRTFEWWKLLEREWYVLMILKTFSEAFLNTKCRLTQISCEFSCYFYFKNPSGQSKGFTF